MYKVVNLFILILFLTACSSNKFNKVIPAKYATEKSYCIKNIKYKPIKKYDYCEIGEASWYGTFENGWPTATGIIFNKDLMTAAHRTLPLPCVVEVTDLKTKKKIKVFVNDRGPFANTSKRIIDLSNKSAKELGIVQRGIAKVKVKCLPYESMLASLYYDRKHYYSRYDFKTKLTPNERKYIKEKIIKDFSPNYESLRKTPKTISKSTSHKPKLKIKKYPTKKTKPINKTLIKQIIKQNLRG